MLREIEAAIVDRLERGLAQVRVRPFPNDLRDLRQPVLSAQILTAYKQSTFRVLEEVPFLYEQLLQFDSGVLLAVCAESRHRWCFCENRRRGLSGIEA